MTDIKSAIEYLEDVFEDVKAMNRSYPDEKFSELSLAIRSLKAWEEVLKELEAEKNKSYESWGVNYLGLKRAIDIINQHLAEIEE